MHSLPAPAAALAPLALLLALVAPAATLQDPGDDPPGDPAPAPASTWVGRAAPELVVEDWLNVPAGARPTLETLRGEVVLLEFWSTVKKACGKGLPHAQAYHERYGPRGLEVLALSYDKTATLAQEMAAYGLSVRVGADTSMRSFRDYGIPEVPWSCLVGRDGRVLFHGRPPEAEAWIVRALGLETDPGALLDQLVAGADGGDRRARLEWLVQSAARAFDLPAWAGERCDAPFGPPGEVAEAGARLDALVAARARGADGAAELRALAALDAFDFDLRGWARGHLAREFPLTLDELRALLAAGRTAEALDALLHRAPSAEALAFAARDGALVAHCASATREARAYAKKALLARGWYLAGVEPRSRQAYWSELGVAAPPEAGGPFGMRTIVIGFETLDADTIGAYVDEQLLRHLVTATLASRRAPDVAALARRVPAERQRMLRALTSKHGEPAPVKD